MSNLADASLSFSLDTAKLGIERLKQEEGYKYNIEHFIEMEARYLTQTEQYYKVIKLFTDFYPEKEEVNGLIIPSFTDSLDYLNQLSYYIHLQNSFVNLSKLNPDSSYVSYIKYLIHHQQDTYFSLLAGDVVGNEPTLASVNNNEFIFSALPHMLTQNSKYYNDEIVDLIISSKAMQLVSDISTNATQANIEKTTNFKLLLQKSNQIKYAKSKLIQKDLSQGEKKELQARLSNLFVESLLLRYKLSILPEHKIEGVKVPRLAEIQSALDPDEAIIEYCINDSLLIYAFITKDTAISKIETDNNFNKLVLSEIRNIKTYAGQGELSTLLFRGIEEELLKCTSLIVIPDKQLTNVPFEWLKLPDSDKMFIDNFTISYNYSTVLWYEHKKNSCKPNENKILAIAPVFESKMNNNYLKGNKRGDVVLAPLHSSKEEVISIQKLAKKHGVKELLLIEQDASEEKLYTYWPNYSIVQISSHGLVDKKNPERSGIYLYNDKFDNGTNDNFLSLGEIYNLESQPNLVVLSACKTGIGKIIEGEGVMALPRGFIYAGVQNVIASLWKVHDEKTKDLMVAFYKHLFEDKVTYAEALRLAKLDCIKNGFLPLDWAGFILIGE